MNFPTELNISVGSLSACYISRASNTIILSNVIGTRCCLVFWSYRNWTPTDNDSVLKKHSQQSHCQKFFLNIHFSVLLYFIFSVALS